VTGLLAAAMAPSRGFGQKLCGGLDPGCDCRAWFQLSPTESFPPDQARQRLRPDQAAQTRRVRPAAQGSARRSCWISLAGPAAGI